MASATAFLCFFEENVGKVYNYFTGQANEKVIMNGIKRLDPVGRIKVAEAINAELAAKKERIRAEQQKS